MQVTIRDAVPEDSDKLIELISLAPMNGVIGLKIDRKPDFFRLLHLSQSFIVLVAEDDAQQIIGCFAATKDEMCIDGKSSLVYYLRDLKVHPDHKGSMIAYHLVKKMHGRLLKEGADILCCTMSSGNEAVEPFFKGRAGIPPFTEIAKYNIYQIMPSHNSKFSKPETDNTTMLAEFFNASFKRFNLSPYKVQAEELNGCINFSLSNEKNIDAAIAAFDPYPYRQNIVTHYSFAIGIMLTILRFFKSFLTLPPLPEKNVPLRIIYAKYYASASREDGALKKLIQQLRHYAFIKNYHLIAIAADDRDGVMKKLLRPSSRFVFKSSLLATSLQRNEDTLSKMKQGLSYEDYSLV